MTDRILLDRPAVARRLGITVEILYRKRHTLEKDGFPGPVFGRMSGERWDPAAIDHWLDGKLPPSPATTSRGGHVEQDWADRLDGRVAQVVGGRPTSRS